MALVQSLRNLLFSHPADLPPEPMEAIGMNRAMSNGRSVQLAVVTRPTMSVSDAVDEARRRRERAAQPWREVVRPLTARPAAVAA